MFKVDVLRVQGRGRCFVLGELNGNFTALGYFVNAVDLDPREDQVILNGNFLGLAPSSREVLAWLNKPWVHAVAGLNEIGVLNKLKGNDRPSLMGQWLAFLPPSAKKGLECAIMNLPIAIECEHDTGFAVVSNKPLKRDSWEETKGALVSWDKDPEGVFSLFGDRLAAISILNNMSAYSDERSDRCLSVFSLALENPSLPRAGKQHVVLTGSSHMNHGSIYKGACLLPYIELSSLMNFNTENEQWLGQVAIEQKSFQMKSSFLRAL